MLKRIIILPIGSYEYHGELLPATTDAIIAEHIARSVSEIYPDSLLLPTLNYGISTEHSDFPETVTVRSEVYLSFVLELIGSIKADSALIVAINGHGGNVNILGAVESEYNYAHSTSKVFIPHIYNDAVKLLCENTLGEFDTHAGSVEASLMAHYINSGNTSVKDQGYVKKMKGSLRFFRTGELNKSGVIKDSESLIMSKESGKRVHDLIVSELSADIDRVMSDINNLSKS